MDLLRRLKFFGFGFVLGMIILLYILGRRGCKSVNHMKVDELISQYTIWSPKAKCKKKLLGLENDSTYYKTMSKLRVNYSTSDVRGIPCGIYNLEPIHRDSLKFEITIFDCDTISKIDDIHIYDKAMNCSCDSLGQ
jgi:hypothetical protein